MITEDIKQRKHNKKFWKDRDRLIYTEVGDGLHFFDADNRLQDADVTLRAREPDDVVGLAYKISTARVKAGFLQRTGSGLVGLKSDGPNGRLVRLTPRAVGFCDPVAKEMKTLKADLSSVGCQIITSGAGLSEVRYPLVYPSTNLYYRAGRGEFSQIMEITDFPYDKPAGWKDEETFIFWATEIDIADPALRLRVGKRLWDGINDLEGLEIDFADKLDGTAFHSWMSRNAVRYTQDEHADVTYQITKRLVERNGKLYLLELLPYRFLKEADYSMGAVRLDYTTKSGTETEDQNWASGTYYISDHYTLGDYDLVISAGVVVKVNNVKSIAWGGGTGYLDVNGTVANPVYFVGKNDDRVGETISGSTGNPAGGDWGYINMNQNAGVTNSIEGTVFRHAGYNASTGVLTLYPSTSSLTVTLNVSSCIFEQCGKYGTNSYGICLNGSYNNVFTLASSVFRESRLYRIVSGATVDTGDIDNVVISNADSGYGFYMNSGDWTVNNLLHVGNDLSSAAFYIRGTNQSLTAYNVTVAHNHQGRGVYTDYGNPSITVKDCIIYNNRYGLHDTGTGSPTWVNDYNCISGNTIADCEGVSAGSNSTDDNPVLIGMNGSASDIKMSGLKVYVDGFYLDQSNSPCVDAGSRTAAAAGMDSKTTHPDGTADSGTVDMGFHWDTFTTGGNGGGGVSIIGKGGPIVRAVS